MSVAVVTGSGGLIGSETARFFARAGMQVTGVDNDMRKVFFGEDSSTAWMVGELEDRLGARYRHVGLDIRDRDGIDRLFAEHGFAYVFHLAAYAAEGLSHFIKRFNYQNNLIGSVNLINAAVEHEVRCFVFASSIAVYGSASPPVAEDVPPSPVDPYGVAKAAVEQELQITRQMFGLPGGLWNDGITPS